MGWEEDMYEKHSNYMQEEIKKVTEQTNYLAIFFGVVVIVGIICTVLYFTKWKKEDEENKKTK